MNIVYEVKVIDLESLPTRYLYKQYHRAYRCHRRVLRYHLCQRGRRIADYMERPWLEIMRQIAIELHKRRHPENREVRAYWLEQKMGVLAPNWYETHVGQWKNSAFPETSPVRHVLRTRHSSETYPVLGHYFMSDFMPELPGYTYVNELPF